MFAEWWLLWWLIDSSASWELVLGTFLSTRMALWTPIPGGAGIYEAGVVSIALWLQADLSTALAVVALSRMRDLGLLGLAAVCSAGNQSELKQAWRGID